MEKDSPGAYATPKCPTLAPQQLEVSLKRILNHLRERIFDSRSIRNWHAFKRFSCGTGEENVPPI
jgi:hypothetical protein